MNSPQKRTLSKTPPSSGVISKIRNTPNKDFIPLVQGSSSKTSSSSYFGMLSTGEVLRPLPKILETGIHLREQTFKDKLKQCSNLYDFGNPLKDILSKDVKRETLLELIDYISTETNAITDTIYQDVIIMLGNNLFRDLPPKVNPLGDFCDPEEDEPVLEMAWPHLQLVYEFVVRFLESSDFDPKKAKKHFTKNFVSNLLKIFDSEDPRERDYLKTILHRIYGKFLHLRPFIRKEIADLFVSYTFGSEKFNGVSEVLEILGSIINGFSVPLKTEHIDYLVKSILPLLRVHYINGFHSQLFYCICQFIEKERKLAENVIRYMLKIWPITNSHKQAIFISAIDDIFYLIDIEEFKNIEVPLFKKLSKCIYNTHFQVAEKTLLLFQNEEFRNFFTISSDTLIPIMYPVLVDVSKMYWNEGIQRLSIQVIKYLYNVNSKAVEKCTSTKVDSLESKIKKQQQLFDNFDRKIQKQIFFNEEELSQTNNLSSDLSNHFDLVDPLPLPEKTYEAIQNHIIKTTSTPQKKKKTKKKSTNK